MILRFALGAAFLAVALPLSCIRKETAKRTTPVAVINGTTLNATEFSKLLARKMKVFDAMAAKDASNVKRAKEGVLREFIVSTLLQQFARQNNLAVSEEELTAEFDRVRKSYPDDLTFKASLVSQGLTLEEWKSSLAKTLLERKVFDLIAGPPEPSATLEQKALKYYETHKAEFSKPAQVRLLQIVVAKEDEAMRLRDKIKAGASFAEMAKRYGTSPDANKGGEVGYIGKGVVPAFDAAFNLQIGQLSSVVKSNYGFHIMKILDKKNAAILTFSQAKPQILKKLAAQKQQEDFDKWLQGVINSAKIERNDLLLEKIKVHTEGPK
jgi:peptidyl-prolyl cis-trans isomerase C